MMFIIVMYTVIVAGFTVMLCQTGRPDRYQIAQMQSNEKHALEKLKAMQNYKQAMEELRTVFTVDIGCGYYRIEALPYEFSDIHTIFFDNNKKKMDTFLNENIIANELIPEEMKQEATLLTLKRYKEIYFDAWMEMAKGLCKYCEYKYIAYPDAIARLYQPEQYNTADTQPTVTLSPYTESTISALRGMGIKKKEAEYAVASANAELAGQEYTEGDFLRKALNALQNI